MERKGIWQRNSAFLKNSMSKKLTEKTEFSQSDIEQWEKLLSIERKDYGEYFFT